MTILNDEVLKKSSAVRFQEAANFKHAQFLIITADSESLNLKRNAELIDVKPYAFAPYTGRAEFRIDRTANTLPLNEVAPKRQYLPRHILIRQTLATDIINSFGFGGVVYLGLTTVPETSSELADRFNELFNLNMDPSDIEEQIIPRNATCVIIRFSTKSVGFKGALRVDLTTPIASAG